MKEAQDYPLGWLAQACRVLPKSARIKQHFGRSHKVSNKKILRSTLLYSSILLSILSVEVLLANNSDSNRIRLLSSEATEFNDKLTIRDFSDTDDLKVTIVYSEEYGAELNFFRTRVVAYTDAWCRDDPDNEEDKMEFRSIRAMRKYDGTDGWYFYSYHTTKDPEICYRLRDVESEDDMEEVVVIGRRIRPISIISITPLYESNAVFKLPPVGFRAVNNRLAAKRSLTKCWQDKVAAAERRLNRKLNGYVANSGYSWAISYHSSSSAFGITSHLRRRIYLFPNNISKSPFDFEHLAIQTAMHEWAHAVQGFRNRHLMTGLTTR